jgi:DNA-binding NarL/FixJ family response regulator
VLDEDAAGPSPRSPLRVAVLADRRVIGEAIALAIRVGIDLRITVGSTEPNVAGAAGLRPDLVIVIGSRADGSTAAATSAARRRWRRANIVAVADTDRIEDGAALLQQGADAWLRRSDHIGVLRSMVARLVAGDRSLMPAQALSRARASVRDKAQRKAQPGDARSEHLTSREAQVLVCLAHGMTRNQIAATLGITLATVRTHVQGILRKLDVHTVHQAVVLALRRDGRETAASGIL